MVALPHDPDAERSVIGAVLRDGALMPETLPVVAQVLELLAPEDFWDPAHADLWRAILWAVKAGERAYLAVIRDRLPPDSLDLAAHCMEQVESPSNAGTYGRIVSEKAMRRAVLKRAEAVACAASNGVVASEVMRLAEDVATAARPSGITRSTRTHDDDGLIRVLTLEDLYAAADEQIPWLLEDVIPARGVTTLVGASGSGKTHFDRAFLRGLTAGDASMGGLALPGTAVPALLVSEWPQALLGTKLQESWGADAAGLPLHVITARIGLAAWESAARMVDDLIRRQRSVEYGLIEVDTMRTFTRLRDENDNAELSRVMSEFARLADEGVPVRLSHHTAKSAGPKTSPQIACAGAHAIPSLSTQTISLSRAPGSNVISLWSAGDLIETKQKMRWDEESELFLPVGAKADSPENQPAQDEETVFRAASALASEKPQAWHSKEALQAACKQGRGLRRKSLNSAIDRLVDSGRFERDHEGRYPRYRASPPVGPS